MRAFPVTAKHAHEWFLANVRIVDDDTSCWEWTSSHDSHGYGMTRVPGQRRSERAHRVAWEIANGMDVPEGLLVMHKCDYPPCVRPDHLVVGTNQDNQDDCTEKGRRASKLWGPDVVEIRRLSAEGWTVSALARKYSVARGTIRFAVTGQTWARVDGPVRPPAPIAGAPATDRAALMADIRAGLPHAEIAAKHGISDVRVGQIAARLAGLASSTEAVAC